jgi:hypothetical protein
LLAAALALVVAGAAIGVLSSGSHPARAVARPVPSFVGRIPALSATGVPPALFAGAVPALAVIAHPARRHRAHRTASTVAAKSPTVSQSVSVATAAPAASVPTASAPVASRPASSSSSTAVHRTTSGSGQTPAFGASGALGPGSSSSS